MWHASIGEKWNKQLNQKKADNWIFLKTRK